MLQGQPPSSHLFLLRPICQNSSLLKFLSISLRCCSLESFLPACSSEHLRSLNNVLRKIWSLPWHSHTGIVQSVAGHQSIYNTVVYCSRKLIASAKISKCSLISDLFSESAASYCIYIRPLDVIFSLVIKYRKLYTDDDLLCANFIRDARINPAMNRHLNSDIYDISTL